MASNDQESENQELPEDSEASFTSRPWECSEFEMELKTALGLEDTACCRDLLAEKGHWLAQFENHEKAESLDAAIMAGESAAELVDLLLTAGVPAHCVYDGIGDYYQHTPVVTAAREGRLDLVQRLVSAGADLFWSSPTGTNVLSEILPSNSWQANCPDSPELASLRAWLHGQGVRINPLCEDSRRKLFWASTNPESWPDIAGLLDLGIPLLETGWTPFMLSIANGTVTPAMAAALPLGELIMRDALQRTPFLLAVTGGRLDIAAMLFEMGSDLHATCHCGATALHLAAKHNHCHLIEWLLAKGLALDVRDEFGNSALSRAVEREHEQAAGLLLSKGADLRERDSNGYGLVHSVSCSGDFPMLRLLVEAGAEINDVSGGGTWLLNDACGAGNPAAVDYLLRAGADPNLTSTGETALFAAVSSDSLACVRLLVECGVDVNATDCDGWTSLFHLVSESVARYLLEHGADPGLPDQCGGLPEDWERVPRDIRQLLRAWRTGMSRSE